MKIKKYHNLRYFRAKFLQRLYEKGNPLNPWLTPGSVYFLDKWISKKDTGFEWGSGRSTIWFGERVSKFVSMEHDRSWYEKVKIKIQKLSDEDRKKIDYKYFDIKDDHSKTEYINYINNVSDELFDFVLVDGRLRDLCSLNAIKKVKKGGILILDNAERYLPNDLNLPESNVDSFINGRNPNWEKFNEMVKDKRQYWTTNGITSTLIVFI